MPIKKKKNVKNANHKDGNLVVKGTSEGTEGV
jgi:hypothetical protein